MTSGADGESAADILADLTGRPRAEFEFDGEVPDHSELIRQLGADKNQNSEQP